MSLARSPAHEDPAVAAANEPGAGIEPRGFWRRWRWPLMFGAPALVLAAAAWFVLTSGRSETTDDAYVQRGKAPVSAAIAGRVVEIDVAENQRVNPGETLFKLDPSDEIAEVDRTQAQLAAAQLQVASLQQALAQARVSLASAQQTQSYAAREYTRQQALAGAGVASRQQLDEARHNKELADAQVDLARQGVATAQANLGPAATNPALFPAVLQASAALERAKLDLTRTSVVAPVGGVVTRVTQLQVGAYVNPAQTVFFLLSGESWVEANFKENQLRKMRVGQPATIQIDACGGQSFAAHVASFSPGAGSSFSPLPAQNATGNWVKVVQRLPVEIAFNAPPPARCARDGLSANVRVDVRSGGQRR
ncbi:MAG TPA: HlyD family secretion protein [Caulobacteraceae bacterium]|nr:HlyD family secretion protein [Caulobacteraceae bacterium]